jgi:hypothetical protein
LHGNRFASRLGFSQGPILGGNHDTGNAYLNPKNRGSGLRLDHRLVLFGVVALSETAAFIIGTKILDYFAMYLFTVTLIVVFILCLNLLWIPALPTATDVAEVFSRGGKGALFRWTKDSVAIVVTATFLTWFVASAFVPLWYYPAHDVFYGTNGENLLGWDTIVAGLCFVVYLAVGDSLPARVTLRAR